MSGLLAPCKQCGKKIAITEKACPHCVAKSPHVSLAPLVSLAILVGMCLAGGALYWNVSASWEAQRVDLTKRLARQEAAFDAGAANRERKNGEIEANVECDYALKRSLRDPSSLKMDHAKRSSRMNDQGWHVIRGYSAENVFGGRQPGFIICQFDKDNNLIDYGITER